MFAEASALEAWPGREGYTILLIVAIAVVTMAVWAVWLTWMRPYVRFLGERRGGRLAQWLPFSDLWRAWRTGRRIGQQLWFVTWFIILFVLDLLLLTAALVLWFKGAPLNRP
jgi:hypothetical protein